MSRHDHIRKPYFRPFLVLVRARVFRPLPFAAPFDDFAVSSASLCSSSSSWSPSSSSPSSSSSASSPSSSWSSLSSLASGSGSGSVLSALALAAALVLLRALRALFAIGLEATGVSSSVSSTVLPRVLAVLPATLAPSVVLALPLFRFRVPPDTLGGFAVSSKSNCGGLLGASLGSSGKRRAHMLSLYSSSGRVKSLYLFSSSS